MVSVMLSELMGPGWPSTWVQTNQETAATPSQSFGDLSHFQLTGLFGDMAVMAVPSGLSPVTCSL